jgi:hypothetical protein
MNFSAQAEISRVATAKHMCGLKEELEFPTKESGNYTKPCLCTKHSYNEMNAPNIILITSIVPDHEKPGSRCRRSKVTWVTGNLERGGNGEGLRKGRSVYE